MNTKLPDKDYDEKRVAARVWEAAGLSTRIRNILWNQNVTTVDELRWCMGSGCHRQWRNCGRAAVKELEQFLFGQDNPHESQAWSPKATPNTRLLTELWLWERLANGEPTPATERDIRVLLEEIDRLRKVVRALEEAARVLPQPSTPDPQP